VRKADPENTEQRRRQVLDAALTCFRRKGFAGASIGDICKEAGMSPGHLYHYFASKDDIVAAIAEQDRKAAAATFDTLARRNSLVDAIVDALDPSVDLGDFGIDGVLAFDVFAEAGRNPRVAEAVKSIYGEVNRRLADLIRLEQAEGRVPSSIDPNGAALTITALVEGLVVMGVSHDETELARAAPSVRTMIAAVLGSPVSDGVGPSKLRVRRAKSQ